MLTVQAGPRATRRLPDGWEPLAPTRFGLAPLTPSIGAEVTGVDLRQPLDDVARAELHRALLEWKVLFLRDQPVTGEQHRAFARTWGELEVHPFLPQGDVPEIVRFEKGDDQKGYENIWHSDVSWRALPSLGSILRCVECPDVGGDTLWADMGAAYDGLSQATKDQIDDLVAVHDWLPTFGMAMDEATRDELRKDFPAVEHPVVRTHPETGRKTIYVNRAFTQHIVGLDERASRELLEHLYVQASFPEYQCRFKWEPGDVAYWDNRSTQHYASSDYFPQRRVMERITVIGDRPV